MEKAAEEASFRRRVLTTIEYLIDIENVEDLKAQLPNLHGIGWDEVIEERFVNKQCGFPSCSRFPPKKPKIQQFQIDKKEGKIYEFCKQRGKFCGEKCYQKSIFIRNQLDEHPLWITGENEKRMGKEYEIPLDETFVCTEAPEKEEELDEEKGKSIEFVTDSIIAKVEKMKVAEEYEEPKEKDEDSEEKESYKLTDDDRDFIKSIKEFRNSNFGAPPPQKRIEKTPAPKLSEKDQKKEEEILERLREKYGNRNAKQKRPPILIAAPELPSKEEKKKTSFSWILDLLRSWYSDETRKLIREGARPTGGAAEQILMDFLSGKKMDGAELNLPNLDKYNVKEKRLNIFLHSIRHHWQDLEARLHLTPTRRDLLNRLATTFHLTSENITGWSKQELNSIVIALFILISLVDVELGDEYFLKDRASPEFCGIARDLCGLEGDQLTGLYSAIKAI
uniref:RNA polymerase II subunit B1 CTD phosphatase RPAP2 homolog n=1 Tax=Caenorhabditis tropicalis TaxID=1561998 RepID=A0A1I7U695_9PELO